MAQQVALGGGPGTVATGTEQERKLKQYLEDERIALFLQNEEFMKELQRNREFLIALERGASSHAARTHTGTNSHHSHHMHLTEHILKHIHTRG